MDAYDVHPYLLARWNGAEDLKKAVIASFECGECRQILEKLEKGEISINDAITQISGAMDDIHKKEGAMK